MMRKETGLSKKRIVIAGHVDHGKSTLLGRLLIDTDQVFSDRYLKVKNICYKKGINFEFSYLLDALEEEQSQGITIDKTEVSWVFEGSEFIFVDTPGHKEFLKNMISGASNAEIAIIMLDAKEGIREQFIRHAHIIGMLGIINIIIVINKMDLVGYSESVFVRIKSEAIEIFKQLKIPEPSVVPISAFFGENIIQESVNLVWYKGLCLTKLILHMKDGKHIKTSPLRLSLQDDYTFTGSKIFVGKIESGSISVGDEIQFFPSGVRSRVKSIESWNTEEVRSECAPAAIGLTLFDASSLKRGEVGTKIDDKFPASTKQINAIIFWMGIDPLKIDKKYKLKMMTQELECQIESVVKVFNSQDFVATDKVNICAGDAAEISISCQKNLICDLYSEIKSTGRFVFFDGHQIVGGGTIVKVKNTSLETVI